MGKPKAPEAPDPVETSAASTGTNVSTALANTFLQNTNQYGPDGSSLEYEVRDHYSFKDPYTGETYKVPMFSATTTLSPEQQRIYDANTDTQLNLARAGEQQSGFLADYLGDGFDPGNLPAGGARVRSRTGGIERGYGPEDGYAAERDEVEAALMERMQGYLDDDRGALEARLANQGITYGSDAYRSAMDDHTRAVNDARMSAIINAGTEQSRLAELDRMQAQFGNAALAQMYSQELGASQANDARRQNTLAELLQIRNQPINETTALMSGSQVSMPGYTMNTPSTIPTTDNAQIINDIYQGELNAYSTQMAGYNSIMGGLFGLAGSILSDRRLKRDISVIGEAKGLPVYAYRYKWEPEGARRVGFMAQDVAAAYPHAVRSTGGVLAIDYGKIQEAA